MKNLLVAVTLMIIGAALSGITGVLIAGVGFAILIRPIFIKFF